MRQPCDKHMSVTGCDYSSRLLDQSKLGLKPIFYFLFFIFYFLFFIFYFLFFIFYEIRVKD